MAFDAVLTGSLKRHAQSLAAIVAGLGTANAKATAISPQVWPGLNEYDSEAVIRAVHSGPLERPRNAEAARQHFRMLRVGLRAWMAGQTQPIGMPCYAEFSSGVATALDHVRQQCEGSVLIVSSGGPISNAVGQILATPHEAIIEMNLRIRNSALSEFSFNPKRHVLQTFNTLPHLDSPDGAALVTYA